MKFRATTQTKSLDYEDLKEMITGKASKRPVVHGYFDVSEDMTLHLPDSIQKATSGDVILVGEDHAWKVSKSYFDIFYQKIEVN